MITKKLSLSHIIWIINKIYHFFVYFTFLDIQIFNLLGECVLSVAQMFPSVDSGQTGMSDLLRVDVSGLPAGVYFVRAGDWVGRFLKI